MDKKNNPKSRIEELSKIRAKLEEEGFGRSRGRSTYKRKYGEAISPEGTQKPKKVEQTNQAKIEELEKTQNQAKSQIQKKGVAKVKTSRSVLKGAKKFLGKVFTKIIPGVGTIAIGKDIYDTWSAIKSKNGERQQSVKKGIEKNPEITRTRETNLKKENEITKKKKGLILLREKLVEKTIDKTVVKQKTSIQKPTPKR